MSLCESPVLGVLFLVLIAYTPSHAADKDFVDNVHQQFKAKINNAGVQQVHSYSKSVLFYKAYASYFERADVNLPGFKKLFQERAEASLKFAENLTEVINQRGGHVTFQNVKLRDLCNAISKEMNRFPHLCFFVLDQSTTKHKKRMKKKYKKPQKAWRLRIPVQREYTKPVSPAKPTALSALEDAVVLERMTNNNLKGMMDKTQRFVDPAMRVKIDNYLEEQVDIIYNLANLVTRLKMYEGNENYELGEYILDSELVH